MKRNATAVWQGTGKAGTGHLTTQSTALNQTQYSFNTRFEEGVGTNPEELIAAAHAGCFNMKLNFLMNEAGFTSNSVEVKSDVELKDGEVSGSHLTVNADVPGISKEKFDELVESARANCIISKLLNTNITAKASLKS